MCNFLVTTCYIYLFIYFCLFIFISFISYKDEHVSSNRNIMKGKEAGMLYRFLSGFVPGFIRKVLHMQKYSLQTN